MTSTRDILGHPEMHPCVFKRLFHYEPCRSCNGKMEHYEEGRLVYTCINYKPEINGYSQQTGERDKDKSPVPLQSRAELGSSADTYIPILIRTPRHTKILPRNYQDWIRRANDRGVYPNE